ncbi:MAG: PQQ-binding-like beta-propeller repeat protein [Planctomycetaceae bacterium]|nr:PQQ-binding-like beta-propeller repeat protein [Planctomycetaceae bacterium]
MLSSLRLPVYLVMLVLAFATAAQAADWPTFRRDAARSGVTDEDFAAAPTVSMWEYRAPFAPQPAFGPGLTYGTNGFGGRIERRRIDFDRCDSAVAAGGRVFFGSVGDGVVRCLDAASGKTLWTFPTGGPVRLAPGVADGKVYFGGDDGWVHCLNAADGSKVWSLRAAPSDLRIPGDGNLISLWPVRTGVLVQDGVAYFAAGIFPNSGIFLYAVDAKSGRVIWKNDREGEKPMAQIVPLGYLLADARLLVMPRGRLAPALFDRRSGDLLCRTHIHAGGGSFNTLFGGLLYAGWESTNTFAIDGALPEAISSWSNPKVKGLPTGGQIVVREGIIYSCGVSVKQGQELMDKVQAWRVPAPRGQDEAAARRGGAAPSEPTVAWEYAINGPQSVILAGKTLIVGALNAVVGLNAADGKELWKVAVEGSALSLAVADGKLLVSTDSGRIYCFGSPPSKNAGFVPVPLFTPPVSPAIKSAADRVLQLAPEATKGYAVIYGVETGELALELARRTQLKIYGVSPDAAKVAAARKMLETAGLWGGRVVVEQWPLERLPYTKYFANLVVSETAVLSGKLPGSAEEMHRIVAPIRGWVVLPQGEGFTAWAGQTPLASAKADGKWAVFNRPALEGAGAWTHAHGSAGATNCSQDQQVRGPLRLQWFGLPGPTDGPNRHMGASPPLAYQGRMFHCSERGVSAYDSFNGSKLWEVPLQAAWRCDADSLGGNAAVGPQGYFVVVHDTCIRLDAATGRKLGEYKVPAAPDGKRRMWGPLMLVEGVLVGSRTVGFAALENNKWTHMTVENYNDARVSDLLFGIDAATGKLLWTYEPGLFLHWNVVAGGGLVFIGHDGATAEQHEQAIEEMNPFIARLPESAKAALSKDPEDRLVCMLAALEVRSGKVRWKRAVDWTACGGVSARRSKSWAQGLLMVHNGILVQAPVSGHKGGAAPVGKYPNHGAAGRDAATGDLKWLSSISNAHRPMIIGDGLYGEPWAFDLKTGKQKMVPHPTTGHAVPLEIQRPYKHCGISSASGCIIVGRSEGMGYIDLLRDQGTEHLSAKRANCWVTSISADGVALWPIGGAGCQCALPIQCSVAMVHDDAPNNFALYVRGGGITPVRNLAVNLGAMGDLRDDKSLLWLAYPRPVEENFREGGIALPLEAEFYEGGAWQRRNAFHNPVAATDQPWIYNSRGHGLRKLTIPARAAGDGPAVYKIALHFAAPAADKAGSRLFDVKIQGKTVRAALDIVKEAGAPAKALVLEFPAVSVADKLTVELVSPHEKPSQAQMPILCGITMTAN